MSLNRSLLLAFSDDKVPNEAALALAPKVGWLLFIGALAVALMMVVQNDRWRRWWLVNEDPRSLALFRIVFGFFTICNINGLWEYFTLLFTDEGIFTADVARQVFAAHQFEGFGDGWARDEPLGFFDFQAVLQFLSGPKYSILYFWDSPTAFWIHLWAFELVAVCFMVGFRTRISGLLTFFLMNSLMVRNHLFWEGTELVYRCMLAYLVLARCGHAYSVDNWLRCRKLRKQGLLSERGGPGNGEGVAPSEQHPSGLQAVYRLIPVWPRRLLMLQLATIYTYTGIVKNGGVWARGDAFYYALNLDHFYRFYPQPMSAVLGTNMFRVMTWVTHWWEVFFPVVVVGLIVRWAIAEKIPRLTGWRLWTVRGCWIVVAAVSGAVVAITWPVHYTPLFPVEWFIGGWAVLCLLIAWLWWRFANRPFVVSRFFGAKPRPKYTLDLRWFATWFLGRRVWLFLGVVFQSHVFFMMNVGQFQTGMIAASITFLTGLEVAGILRGLGHGLARWGFLPVPTDVARGEAPLPAEDPDLPHLHRDTAKVPLWGLLGALGIISAGIIIHSTSEISQWWWTLPVAFVWALVATIHASRRTHQQRDRTPTQVPPWSYGPIGRLIVGTLIVWHLVAVATWLMPEKDCLKSFRDPARAVFAKWLTVTQTDQGWGMFAPNPPRQNVFLQVLVTTADGGVMDLKTDVYAPEMKPIPWIWNDRIRKINRRIIGGESGPTDWYRKWYARYICRQWALENGGEAPVKVELVKVSYSIPSPEQVRDHGWYSPEQKLKREGDYKVEYTEHCAPAMMGQLPNWIRERHGLDPLPDNVKYRPWIKPKYAGWRKRHPSSDQPQEASESRKD